VDSEKVYSYKDTNMKNRPLFAQIASLFGAAFAAAATAQTASLAQADDQISEVVITGSRVIKNGNDSPTPLTVVSMDQLMEANPGPVTQALSQIPALLGTYNQGQQGGGPQAVINLRGIGQARNLILFDGHRMSPTLTDSFGAVVDTNLIPTMLLKRVDIVTGGASAVYGSDAVSGVVNYVMDSDFNGLKVTGQMGESTYNDDRTYNIGIAAGTHVLGDRGHIEFSYQNYNDPGLPSRFSRGWGRGLWSLQGTVVGSTTANPPGSVGNPWALYSNTRLNNTNFGGVINTGPLAGLQFAQNGVLSPFNPGTPTGSAGQSIGGDGGYYTTVTAFAGQNMDQGFGRFDYQFTDGVKGYAELAISRVDNWSNGNNDEVRTKAIGYNNAYLAAIQPAYQAKIAAAAAANPLGSFNFSRIFTGDQFSGPRTDILGKQYLFISGLEGSWGRYHWDVGFEHSTVTTLTDTPNGYSLPRLYAAMNAVVNPATNQVVCNAALVNPAVYGNCVPLNLFGPSSMNQAAVNYVMQDIQNTATFVTDDATVNLTGAPVSSWAGPIDMALSGEWRRPTYKVDSNATPTDPFDCTGIQFNCVSSGPTKIQPYVLSYANFPQVSETVAEAAYEANVPLLTNQTLAKSMALNAAVRYVNYSTSGSVWPWKLGLTWKVNDDWVLRTTRSRDIRAPGLTDLYAPPTFGFLNLTDSHTGLTGIVPTLQAGNSALTPEISDTVTAGFVWTPKFVDGLSVTLDYYHIHITNGIARITAAAALCEQSNGTSPLCSTIIRPLPFSDRTAANFPTEEIFATLNTAGFLTYGLDSEVNYTRRLYGRNFGVRLIGNYQPHLINYVPTGPVDVGGAADGIAALQGIPNVKALLQVNYDVLPTFTVTVQERYRNAERWNGNPVQNFAIGKIGPAKYTDLTLSYKLQALGGDVQTFLSIRNLFNTPPQPWASSGGTAQIGSFGGYLQGFDDAVGRYYTVGFRYKL
jgi:outer membrane receptor protein involved in Fe transport